MAEFCQRPPSEESEQKSLAVRLWQLMQRLVQQRTEALRRNLRVIRCEILLHGKSLLLPLPPPSFGAGHFCDRVAGAGVEPANQGLVPAERLRFNR